MKKSRKRRRQKIQRIRRVFLACACTALFAGIFLAGALFFLKNPETLQKESKEESAKNIPESEEPASDTGVSETAEPETESSREETPNRQTTEETAGQKQPGDAAREMVEETLAALTLEEKVAQMFIVTPEALTGVSQVTAAGETTRTRLEQYPVGGIVYFEGNLQGEDQIREMLERTRQYSLEQTGLLPFLCVDEEGGTVARISGRGVAEVPYIESMESVGQQGEEAAYQTGQTIGAYLSDLGFNVDFAPVADLATNPENTVIGSRSFSGDPHTGAAMVSAFVEGIRGEGVLSSLKHFPGHGDTSQDSHTSAAVSYKTLEELKNCEFVPFQSGIEAGADLVMAGHISLPNVTGNDTPASLSYEIITGILRETLGYEGAVVTDGMNMGAIVNYYSSGEAAVRAIEAGVDLVLMPEDFPSAYQGVLDAVAQGRISQERIDESLRRILKLKIWLRDGWGETSVGLF